MSATERVARGLGGHRAGRGWVARCPCHEDHDPSLSLADGDGRLLVKCHAGCDHRGVSVWAALGTSGMTALELPNPPTELVVAPDGDPPGAKAAEGLARRAAAAGWRARIVAAQGTGGRDWAEEVAA